MPRHSRSDASRPDAPADEWVVLGEGEKFEDARRAALTKLADLGVSVHPAPGRHSLGILGGSDDDVRIDLFCGRTILASSTRISIRKPALSRVSEDRLTDQ